VAFAESPRAILICTGVFACRSNRRTALVVARLRRRNRRGDGRRRNIGNRVATKRKTGGRTKGTPNKINAAVKEAIIGAFNKVGGEAYLVKVAESDPRTFCALLGKVMPTQLTGAGEGPIRVANEGNENARDILFAKLEQMRRRKENEALSDSPRQELVRPPHGSLDTGHYRPSA
jgi:hypothetical protein